MEGAVETVIQMRSLPGRDIGRADGDHDSFAEHAGCGTLLETSCAAFGTRYWRFLSLGRGAFGKPRPRVYLIGDCTARGKIIR